MHWNPPFHYRFRQSPQILHFLKTVQSPYEATLKAKQQQQQKKTKATANSFLFLPTSELWSVTLTFPEGKVVLHCGVKTSIPHYAKFSGVYQKQHVGLFQQWRLRGWEKFLLPPSPHLIWLTFQDMFSQTGSSSDQPFVMSHGTLTAQWKHPQPGVCSVHFFFFKLVLHCKFTGTAARPQP